MEEVLFRRTGEVDHVQRHEFEATFDDGDKLKVAKYTFWLNEGWKPDYAYAGLANIYLLDLVHTDGNRAYWIVDRGFRYLGNRIENLSDEVLAEVYKAYVPLLARVRELTEEQATNEDPFVLSFLRLSDEFRRQLLFGFWRLQADEVGNTPGEVASPQIPTRPDHRPVLSICFSGQPRAFLAYKESWAEFFSTAKEKFDVRIYFHAWADTGLVKMVGDVAIEGQYEDRKRYGMFDELISVLEPTDFMIESTSETFESDYEDYGPVLLLRDQAPKRNILSQLYSIEMADRLRQRGDLRLGPSSVVMKVRFDLTPATVGTPEMCYIAEHPEVPVIFAPSPSFHRHPGGGGGCRTCNEMFLRDQDTTLTNGRDFYRRHPCHSNDVCDLFALGGPDAMSLYSSLYSQSARIWRKAQAYMARNKIRMPLTMSDPMNPVDRRIVTNNFDAEQSIHCFYPEKLIRFGVTPALIVDSDITFHIKRR